MTQFTSIGKESSYIFKIFQSSVAADMRERRTHSIFQLSIIYDDESSSTKSTKQKFITNEMCHVNRKRIVSLKSHEILCVCTLYYAPYDCPFNSTDGTNK